MLIVNKLGPSQGAVILLVWLGTAAIACDPKKRPFADIDAFPIAGAGGAASTGTVPGETFTTDAAVPNTEDLTSNVDDLAANEASNMNGDIGPCGSGEDCAVPDAGVGVDGGVSCPGCLIRGECVAADALETENPCRICDPERDPLGWSANDGITCDDGLFCTVDDICRTDACEGVARNCEDGVACNGISTCDEMGDLCTEPINQCGANASCDTQADTCVSTCTGCLVDGVCVPRGAQSGNNSCLVCNPAQSSTSYTPAVGASCGAAATACSGADTCDAEGRCQPNHLPADTACDSQTSSACDQADACDGNGNCQQRVAANGTPCDDGQFCTIGDQCQGGRCVAGGDRSCGVNQTCNEVADQCQCQGCSVGNTCIPAGAVNPSNPCQVCNPGSGFIANVGAQCGAGPTQCSNQDTCNAQGQCAANDLPNGTSCGNPIGGSCQGGGCAACSGCVVGTSCVATGAACTGNQVCSAQAQCVSPFVCGEASPPRGAFPPVQAFTGSPTGGTIVDGAYVETQQLQPAGAFIIGQSFAFRGPFVHWRTTEFFDANDPGGPLDEAVGTYSTSGNLLTMGLINCATAGTITLSFQYSASSTGLDLIGGNVGSISARFARQ